MAQLRIRLLGQLAMHHDGDPVTELSTKASELFCYLLLYRDRAHTRETLADMLWTGTPAARAQKYLRQTLWQLQVALERHLQSSEDTSQTPLLLDPGWIRINPRTVWLDVAELEQAHVGRLESPGRALTSAQMTKLEAAIVLYQGDLLANWYQDWCIYERERLQLVYLAILDKLVDACTARRQYSKGIEHGHQLLRCDPAREATYQRLMRLYYLAGDRTTALREYTRCVRALAREFDLAPTTRTTALYEQICADRLADPSTLDAVGRYAPAAATGPHVIELRTEVAHLRTEVRQGLAAIVHLLEDQEKILRQTSRQTR